jgi:hypothetical protein
MNWYKVFYWMTVSNGVKQFFDKASDCFTTFTIIFFLGALITTIGSVTLISINSSKNEEEDKIDPDIRAWKLLGKYCRIAMYTSLGLCIFTWIGYVAVPSQKDALIIITGGTVGNFITNDSSSKVIPAEAMTLLRDKIREEIKSVNLQTVLQVGTDTLKGKTQEELINIIKSQGH